MSLPNDPRIADLFDQVADLTPDKRVAYLEEQCASDTDLRAAVLDFLRKADAARSSNTLARALRPSESFSAYVEFSMDGATRQGITLGSQIGKYVIAEKLDEGGMGVVYVAEHKELQRRAAVKVMHATQATSQDMVQRFINEARAATRIDHPGIVEIFDVGRHPSGDLYILMEYLVGESLEKRLKNVGKMPEEQAVSLVLQAARALQAAHDKDIVHRDLKPANIFLVADPEVPGGERVKLLDFGIAKLRETRGEVQTKSGIIMGTPPYMSPEQCLGSRSVDHRTDLYAVGVILFEMLAGRRPFKRRGHGEYIIAHIHQQPPPVTDFAPSTSERVTRIIDRLLAKDRELRYRSAAELAAALEGGARSDSLPPSAVPTVDAMPTMADSGKMATVALQSGDWQIASLASGESAGEAEAPGEASDAEPSSDRDLTTDLSGRRASAEHIATSSDLPARRAPVSTASMENVEAEECPQTTLSGAAGQTRHAMVQAVDKRPVLASRRQILGGVAALAAMAPGLWFARERLATVAAKTGVANDDHNGKYTGDTGPGKPPEESERGESEPPGGDDPVTRIRQDGYRWLADKLDTGRVGAKLAIIQAIERAGVRSCAPLLWHGLKLGPEVRLAAARAALALALPEAVSHLHDAMAYSSSDTRRQLQIIAVQLGDVDSRAAVRKLARKDGLLSLNAAYALTAVPDADSARPRLSAVFSATPRGRSDWQVAARGLRTLGEARATRALRAELVREEPQRVLKAAAALIQTGPADEARIEAVQLMQRIVTDESFTEPGEAALLLARAGDPYALRYIDRGLVIGDDKARALALAVTARFRARVQSDARTIAMLTQNDKDLRVKIQAHVTLQAMSR